MRFEPLSTHNGLTSDYVGLSEVRFVGPPEQARKGSGVGSSLSFLP